MASSPPNPRDEDEAGEESTAAPQKTYVAPPAAQLPSKLQYVALGAPGPSGIKQCFRTVKAARRVPTLGRRETPEPRTPRRDRSKRHACPTCDKRFSSPGKLTQHQLSHTGELPFSCNLCDKRFNSKFKLVRHNLIHSEARAFACTICGRTFNRKDHLTNHVRVHNPVKKLFTCERPDCRKSYTSLLSYRKHAALHSAEEGNLQCEICDEVFTCRQDIVYHLKVHTGSRTVKNETDKKFTCDYCERRFFTAKDVRRHLVVHTGRRDFLCPFCPQKFGRKDHLVRHVKNAHPDESWRSASVGTSNEPAPAPEPPPPPQRPKPSGSAEETFTISSPGFLWKQDPEEGSSKGPTRVPSSDIIVEIPPDLDIKVEPLDIKIEEPASPNVELIDYPMVYVVPGYEPAPAPTLPYMADILDPGMLLDPGPSGMLNLLEEPEQQQQQQQQFPEEPWPQRLPAFTQAFQTSQTPKPPPQPPPAP